MQARLGAEVPDNQITTDDSMDAEERPAPAQSPVTSSASVVALVSDATLIEMLGKAVEGRRRVWRADDIVHAADLLLAAPHAVLLLDAAVTGERTAELVAGVHGQFKDLPIIVSGRLSDEVGLGALISSGVVFRFLHKPVSVERARNFIEAAVRRLDETPVRRPPAGDVAERLPTARMPVLQMPRVRVSHRLIGRAMVAAGALLVLILLAWGGAVLVEQAPWKSLGSDAAEGTAGPGADADRAALQKLLDAAGVAISQGRLVVPEDRSALALYRAALARDPANSQARQGLTRVADALLGGVEQALLAGDLATAAGLLDAARGADPGHPRLTFLSIQLEDDSKQLQQQAAEAASGRPAEARATEQRVAALLSVADQRIKAGKLVGGLDSAEAYLLEARQAAPDDQRVRQALRALSAAMLANASQARTDNNEAVARDWLQRAQALGVDPEGVSKLNAQLASARQATMVEDLSRLLALANQRIAQGTLLEPTTDSARHYLDLLRAADPAFPGAAETEALLAAKLLEETRRLGRAERVDDAGRLLAAAEAAGASKADLDATRAAVATTQAMAEAARTILPENALIKVAGEPPGYPARAESRGIEGWVDVQFTVTTTGATRDIVVTGASPEGAFDEAVLDAVSRWRYEPHLVSGIPVDQRVQLRLRFKLARG